VDSLKPIYWHQGLFLQPQHFQLMQTSASAVAIACSEIKTGISNGISDLEINEDDLKNGQFGLRKFRGVLTDDTILAFPGNANIPSLTLSLHSPDSDGNYDIYLSLIPLKRFENNLADPDDDVQKRYVENTVEVIQDQFDSQESSKIKTLSYDVRLFVGTQPPPDGCIVEHIARVVNTGNGFSLATDFIPNVQFVRGSRVLQDAITDLKGNLISRFEQLESFTSLAGNRHAELNGASLTNLMAMNTLAHFVPVFSQFSEIHHTRVEDVYLSCRQLISQLSMFSKHTSITGQMVDSNKSVVAFRASNFGDMFYRAFSLINQLLDELTIDPERLIELTKQGDSKFIVGLSADFLASNTNLYIRLRTESKLAESLDEFTRFAKAGADGQVDIYTKRSLPGVPLTYLARKPLGVASTPNSYYFSVDRFCFEWQKVIESGRLGLIWPTAPSDLCVELIAVRG